MAISAASIRGDLPATDRLAIPLLQLQEEIKKVSGVCVACGRLRRDGHLGDVIYGGAPELLLELRVILPHTWH